MSINDLDSKVAELRDLRNFEAEIRKEITAIEDDLKAEMLSNNTDTLTGTNCLITWKTFVSSRFDSAAFKLTHSDLFRQYSKTVTSRRFVIA